MTQAHPTRPDLVSVVIPCYNAAEFLRETLDAVLAQTYPALEVIVIDDASSDSSWEIVQAYGDRVTAVRLEHNRGGSHARNRGAELAGGELLMFLDADDVIAPESIQALVAAVRDHPRSFAVCRWHRWQRLGGEWGRAAPDVPFPEPGDDVLRRWLEGIWVPPCAVLWRRDAYDLTEGWDEQLTFNDDGDLVMRALIAGAELRIASGGESLYRLHDNTHLSVGTNLFSGSKVQSGIRVLEKVERELGKAGLRDRYETSLGVAYQRFALYALQHGHAEVARDCQHRGELLAGKQAVSPTPAGRVLERVLGLERKERLAEFLARVGISRRARRIRMERAAMHGSESVNADTPNGMAP